jgi:hypothetical protein
MSLEDEQARAVDHDSSSASMWGTGERAANGTESRRRGQVFENALLGFGERSLHMSELVAPQGRPELLLEGESQENRLRLQRRYAKYDGVRERHCRFEDAQAFNGFEDAQAVNGFEDSSPNLPFLWEGARRVLLLGERDAGKSFLLARIAHDWALHSLWRDRFVGVIRVRLVGAHTTPLTHTLERAVIDEVFGPNPKETEAEQHRFFDWVIENRQRILWLFDDCNLFEGLCS